MGISSSGGTSNSDGAKANAKRELQAVVQPIGEGEGGGSGEQVAKKIKSDAAPHFPIHEIAEVHRLSTSDSDDDQSNCEVGNAWWHEVECQVEDDFKADRNWWEEVESDQGRRSQ